MKIKLGFISNSSSSSYYFFFRHDGNKKSFCEQFNIFLLAYIAENSWKDDFEFPPLLSLDEIIETEPNVFKIENFIPIYNDEMDLPEYVQNYISDLKNDKGPSSKNIELIEWKVVDKNS